MTHDHCPFCQLHDAQCAIVTPVVRAFRDSFPVSDGHTLIIPRRHVMSMFDLEPNELAEIWTTVGQVRQQLQQEFTPAGFNIGINDGTAAGQTVPHAHLHVIPRYAEDVPDPRGGVPLDNPGQSRLLERTSMNGALDGLSSRYPEKTLLLGQVFNDTAASYKFFWLLGLLTLLQKDRNGVFAQREIIEEMLVAAWHPVCFYRLSLGAQDHLQHTVLDLKTEAGLENDSLPEAIRPKVKSTIAAREGLRSLTSLVPTRFLSPWFAVELRGVDGHVRTRRIQELAAKSQLSSCPCPYFFERVGAETWIHVNESWAGFFRENFEVIRSFVFFHLCRYLQARNPNVPGIVNKLSAPIMRDLGPARRFWRTVRGEFNRTGDGHLFQDIYSGTRLDDSFSIDHFLPWSFVAHDLLWNLTPVTATTNSKKSDALPSLELYLPRLSHLHRRSLLIMKDKPKLLEDYVNWLRSDINGIVTMSDEQFHQRYRESIEPQLQIAQNQGFQANWSWS